jgi:ketosteroid isomerase-like protein
MCDSSLGNFESAALDPAVRNARAWLALVLVACCALPLSLAQASEAQVNQRIIESLYAAFQRGDAEAIAALMHEDVEWIAPGPSIIPFAGKHRGRDSVQRFFELAVQSIDVIQQTVHRYIAQRDQVAVLVLEHMRAKRTGKEYRTEAVHLYTLRDGRVVRFEEFADTAAQAAAFEPDAAR